MNNFKNLLFFLGITVFLTSCKTKKEEYTTIGAILPLTGAASSIGVMSYNGFTLAVNKINANGGVLGKKLDLIILDDEFRPEKALEQYEYLKSKNVAAIIGASNSIISLELAKKSNSDSMPFVVSAATNPNVTVGFDNVFRACFIDDYQARIMAKFSTENLKGKTALIFSNSSGDSYVQQANIFANEFSKNGGEVLGIEVYDDTIKSFSEILSKYTENKPDIIFCPDYFINSGILINEANILGFTTTNFIGTDVWDSIINEVDDKTMSDRIFFSSAFSKESQDENVENFITEYFSTYSELPLSYSALCYDSVFIVSDAIERASSIESDLIISALNSSNLSIITGQIVFDKNHNPSNSNVAIISFKNQEKKTITKLSL